MSTDFDGFRRILDGFRRISTDFDGFRRILDFIVYNDFGCFIGLLYLITPYYALFIPYLPYLYLIYLIYYNQADFSVTDFDGTRRISTDLDGS